MINPGITTLALDRIVEDHIRSRGATPSFKGHHGTLFVENDGWTARTIDGSICVQYEHTVAITDNGPEILTKL